MENIKLSILVPIYNAEKYVERCVVSLMEQTLEEIEFIFVDDCSTDKSLDILQSVLAKYPLRHGQVQVLRHSFNRGSSAARNTALEVAKGEFITFADSDDWLEPHGAKEIYSFAKRNGLDIAYSRFYKNYSDGNQSITKYTKCDTYEEAIRHIILGHFNYVVWNKIYRREFVNKCDVRFLEGFSNGEDIGFNIKLIAFTHCIAEYDGAPYYHYSDQIPGSYTSESRRSPLKNVPSVVANVNSAIAFLRSRGLYEKYEKELTQVKINTRNLYLNTDKECLKAWLNTYPETNEELLHQIRTTRSRAYSISFWLLTKGCLRQYIIYEQAMDKLNKFLRAIS